MYDDERGSSGSGSGSSGSSSSSSGSGSGSSCDPSSLLLGPSSASVNELRSDTVEFDSGSDG